MIRDRTPAVSETDSDSDCSADEIGRIIVPPGVNCVVRDTQVTQRLPTILNAKVMIITALS